MTGERKDVCEKLAQTDNQGTKPLSSKEGPLQSAGLTEAASPCCAAGPCEGVGIVIITACVIITGMGLWCVAASPTLAQTSTPDWSEPIPLFYSSGFSRDPQIIADRGGHLHVFWIENPTPNPDSGSRITEAILYQEGDGSGWATPVDVLVAPPAAGISEL